MNNKGQLVMIGLMIAIVATILLLNIIPALVESSNNARSATTGDTLGLDCDNESISDYDKATCITTDLTSAYFFWVSLGIIGIIFFTKIIIEGTV